MASSKYDSYSGSTQSYDNVELRLTPMATFRGEITRAFGTASEYGQSLGVNFENVRLDDGGLYYYPDGDYYKLFSWEEITGFMPDEHLARGDELTADDADEVLTKSYFGEQMAYELVAARVPETETDDGTIEASSRGRTLNGVNDGVPDFTDFEDFGGDRLDFRDVVMWFDGTDEYGPSASATSMLETVTRFGSDAVVDSGDIHNWLPDTTGEDILRDDLDGREVELFIVPREGQSGNTYYDPVLLDVSTGERVTANNRSGGGDGSGSGGTGNNESALVAEAREKDAGAFPEPIADFINSGRGLNMDAERANTLLDELIADSDNALTEEMIQDEVGDREALIDRVT
jgi:hypothetical protein